MAEARTKPTNTFIASSCITSAHLPLVKASHLAKPKVQGWEVHSTSTEDTPKSHDRGHEQLGPPMDTAQGGCPGRLT